jgi:hypothetical protein
MKLLSDYVQEDQTKIFRKHGAFFAFSNKQLADHAVKDVEYVNTGGGLICPKQNARQLRQDLDACWKAGIEQHKAEQSKYDIIKAELYNHEAFYTWDIQDTLEALDGYGYTKNDIQGVLEGYYGPNSFKEGGAVCN